MTQEEQNLREWHIKAEEASMDIAEFYPDENAIKEKEKKITHAIQHSARCPKGLIYTYNTREYISEIGKALSHKEENAVGLVWYWDEQSQKVKVSFSSVWPRVDVDKIAAKFDGGGNAKEAKASMYIAEFYSAFIFDGSAAVDKGNASLQAQLQLEREANIKLQQEVSVLVRLLRRTEA